jgi:malate dehydrogenase (oxaloacetate-decarboxylating)(NADP+)
MSLKDEALAYHEQGRPGKIEVIATKPCTTQQDLSLAYTPGVAEPCRAIQKNPDDAYRYTARGNLVAVVTNGTAVLGLGNIGPLAGKPVMEGKGILFKRFADIDVFDLEIASEDPDEVIRVVKLLEPTFGGINLEDIKSPQCFTIENTLKEQMGIPVFHDYQHGTAVISGAALINAALVQKKELKDLSVVFSGAGAAAISCARHYVRLGVDKRKITMVDSLGVIYKGRCEGMNAFKEEFAAETKKRTLAQALEGADVLAGLSSAGLVTAAMVKTMAARPIIFAMANPDPEIGYALAKESRPDAVVATGRSDFPNQVNNVLGFPFIFRGALDVRAKTINDPMKVAATLALAGLARQKDIPQNVLKAYNLSALAFGPEYIIPKPMDGRVLVEESLAVAEAAVATGVARLPLYKAAYRKRLTQLAEKLQRE